MTSDLDLTPYLPSEPKHITIGDKSYAVSTDIPSVIFDRVVRWFDEQPFAEDEKIPDFEERGIVLVMRVLHLERDEVTAFGPMVRRGVLGFLRTGQWIAQKKTLPPSEPPSDSPASSTEESRQENS